MKNLQQLLDLNRKGFFFLPYETEDHFLKRVKAHESFYLTNKAVIKNCVSSEEWNKAKKILSEKFDFSPDWMLAYYSDKELLFWQGAVTWIEHPHAFIQLGTAFKKGKFLLNSSEEVLAHEAIHNARSVLEQNKFEEIFAYLTSRHRLMRIFGPLFSSPFEAAVLVVLFLLNPIFLGISIFWNLPFGDYLFFCIPWMYLALLIGRLIYRKWILNKCLIKLRRILIQPSLAVAFAFRLLDEEIVHFAKTDEFVIKEYINQKSTEDLRWEILKTAYL